MSKKIKLTLATGMNTGVREQTPHGVFIGEEIVKEVYISPKQAQELIQSKIIDPLSYQDSIKFYKKYSK